MSRKYEIYLTDGRTIRLNSVSKIAYNENSANPLVGFYDAERYLIAAFNVNSVVGYMRVEED